MRYFAIAALWLSLAAGALLVPVTFSVDGFGIVVSPDGVRSVRAIERGTVRHFVSEGEVFAAGDIISAVEFADIHTENQFLLQTLRRDLAKTEADRLEAVTRLTTTLERDRAKMDATLARLSTRRALTEETRRTLGSLRDFVQSSETEVDELNAERTTQLDSLEDMLRRSLAAEALPAQRAASMLDDIQSQRLSLIDSESSKFSSDRMILDLSKELNQLDYENAIDTAEIEILAGHVRAQERQVVERQELAASLKGEARTKYLARLRLPQIAIAKGSMADMRQLQAEGAVVARDEALRILALRDPASGISIQIFGALASGRLALGGPEGSAVIDLERLREKAAGSLKSIGLSLLDVNSVSRRIAGIELTSVFLSLEPSELVGVRWAVKDAQNAEGDPVFVQADLVVQDRSAGHHGGDAVIGFLENKHAVALQWDQIVHGAVQDIRSGRELRFEGRLLEREFAPVDTAELGVRLGNQSLAGKIIARGGLSQVAVVVDPKTSKDLQELSGAIVHLSFPIARRSLISFLMERDAAL